MDAGLLPVPDGGCAAVAQSWIATMVTVPVSWPAAVTSGITVTNAGTGNVVLVTLSNEMSGATAGSFTGAARTCATAVPAVQFSATGASLGGIPSGDTGFLSVSLPDSLWDKIGRTSPLDGSSTGLNPGATVTTDPSVALFGLASTSSFANASTAWPAACTTNCTPAGPFKTSDLDTGADGGANDGDDDGDGNPGVTAIPVKMLSGKDDYVLPPVSVGGPTANQVFIVTRTALAVATTRLDCYTASGTATVTAFDDHVVGCHLSAGGNCNSTQTSFLDSNRVVYTLTGGATVKTKVIMGNASPSCADARAAVGFTG